MPFKRPKHRVIDCPTAWAAYAEIRHISPTAIKLDEWPAGCYAGDRDIYGHRVNRIPRIGNDNQGWLGYAPHLK